MLNMCTMKIMSFGVTRRAAAILMTNPINTIIASRSTPIISVRVTVIDDSKEDAIVQNKADDCDKEGHNGTNTAAERDTIKPTSSLSLKRLGRVPIVKALCVCVCVCVGGGSYSNDNNSGIAFASLCKQVTVGT